MDMEKQKFQSARRYQMASTCPCGKSNKDGKFAPFKSYQTRGGGYCHSCGELFHAKKDDSEKLFKEQVKEVNLLRQEPKRTVDHAIVLQTLQQYEYNNFYTWFHDLVGTQDCIRIFKYFSVGTAKYRGTIFWYQDINGRWVNGKKLKFKLNGKRNKEIHPKYLFRIDDGYSHSFFGEFQLRFYPLSLPVNILESEKSVVLSFWKFPNQIWLASGSSTGCTKDKAAILRNRSVRIFNDMDEAGRAGAERACRNFKKLGIEVKMVDLEPGRNDGADIGDLILEQMGIPYVKNV